MPAMDAAEVVRMETLSRVIECFELLLVKREYHRVNEALDLVELLQRRELRWVAADD